ncbi:hypothetical protein GCM10011499_13850 [Pelagibacterium lentulum]|uniref:Uncharacterized protein n=1 Tax=Pelagibacterium lentulum TaxID=2029865 RepID=A0A916VWJ7_9HYPH|nr:hypothetical protein GCM10011499_13850 [Pelagibacterium lentulum]
MSDRIETAVKRISVINFGGELAAANMGNLSGLKMTHKKAPCSGGVHERSADQRLPVHAHMLHHELYDCHREYTSKHTDMLGRCLRTVNAANLNGAFRKHSAARLYPFKQRCEHEIVIA